MAQVTATLLKDLDGDFSSTEMPFRAVNIDGSVGQTLQMLMVLSSQMGTLQVSFPEDEMATARSRWSGSRRAGRGDGVRGRASTEVRYECGLG